MNVPATTEPAPHEVPFYSIVIPVYNEEDVVGHLLSEIRTFVQTWSGDYELLLVDDGSADRTAEIVGKQFADWPQGKLIRLSQNCGQAAALFYGMKCGKTPWCARLQIAYKSLHRELKPRIRAVCM